MAENDQDPIQIRRISLPQRRINTPTATKSRSGRTIGIGPGSGQFFDLNELLSIIPPSNARSYKIVRVFGGRYRGPQNPSGLGTEGPFDISEFPTQDSDLSGLEDLQITRVIFDVGD